MVVLKHEYLVAAKRFRYDTTRKITSVVHRVLEPILRSLSPEAACQIARVEADEQLQQELRYVTHVRGPLAGDNLRTLDRQSMALITTILRVFQPMA